jgi:hypothetical protein
MKINKTNLKYHYYRLHAIFYTTATNIQAFIIACDVFLCTLAIDLSRQSI